MENTLANNDDWELRVATSISALNDFLELQQSSLDIIKEDIKKLEDLKALGMVEPVGVLRTAVNNSSEAYMRHSEVCLELEASVPGLDWSLFESAESQSATPISLPDASSSCASRIKSTMARFEQSIAALPPLPADLLDSVENKGKKRKRSELIPRDSAMPPACRLSGGLRLPDLSHNHNSATHSLKLSSIGKLPLEPHRRSTSTTNSSSGLHETFTPTSSVDPIPQPHADYSHTDRPPWASKSTGTFDAITRSTPESPPDSPMSNRDETFHEETISTLPHETEELPVTFKKNWSLAEQHTLERLLSEIPSTVKFRWVKISEAMGGTRTPRQVASRVQKYYDKMKKLGVAVDLADMGGGGRGGSKAIQDSDMPGRKSTSTRLKGQSARGMPKTGPQYTKSGRRR